MTEGSIYYNLATYQERRGEYRLRICLYPRIALWNPYNIRLDLDEAIAELFVNGNKDVELQFGSPTDTTSAAIGFGRLRQSPSRR